VQKNTHYLFSYPLKNTGVHSGQHVEMLMLTPVVQTANTRILMHIYLGCFSYSKGSEI